MSRVYWNAELETKPWPEVEAWQAGKVAEFLRPLGRRSAFYQQRLAGRRQSHRQTASLELLRDLPFTAKDDLRRSQEEGIQGQPFGLNQAADVCDIVQAVSSSGTTGRPVYYALTRRDLNTWMDGIATVFFTNGIRADDMVAHLVGLPVVAGGLPYADAFRHIGATLAWLGGLPTERILASIRHLQVTAMLSTASFGVYLTDHCRDLTGSEASALGVKKLLAGGEPGLGQPEIREKIRRGWGLTHIREMMGLADVMAAMWGECDDESGMHFNAQRYVAVELINPQTGEQVPWQDGASGEAVYTTFDRDATPVLRYRSADHLVVTGTSCPCGRTSPKIRCVGRTDDMLIYKGMNVFPSAVREVVLRNFSDVVEPYLRIWKERADQVRFDTPIPLEVEAREGVEPERFGAIAEAIGAELREQLQVRVRVSIVPPGTLPRSVYKTPLVYVKPAEEVGS